MRTRHCLHLSAGTRSPPELSTHLAFCACERPGSAAAQWRWMRRPPTAEPGTALPQLRSSKAPAPAPLLCCQNSTPSGWKNAWNFGIFVFNVDF